MTYSPHRSKVFLGFSGDAWTNEFLFPISVTTVKLQAGKILWSVPRFDDPLGFFSFRLFSSELLLQRLCQNTLVATTPLIPKITYRVKNF